MRTKKTSTAKRTKKAEYVYVVSKFYGGGGVNLSGYRIIGVYTNKEKADKVMKEFFRKDLKSIKEHYDNDQISVNRAGGVLTAEADMFGEDPYVIEYTNEKKVIGATAK